MGLGRTAAVLALGLVVTSGAIYAHDRFNLSGANLILHPPLPGPVSPYIDQAAKAVDNDAVIPESVATELAEQIFQHSPLSAAPFVLLADERLKKSRLEDARMFALEVLQRDPRNARLQIQLANDAAQRGDLPDAVERLAALMRVDPKQGDTYLAAMARITGTPEGPSLIESQLSKSPIWGATLVNLLALQHPDIAFVGRIARPLPKAHESYLARLVRDRGAAFARNEWLGLLAPAELSVATGIPFNSTFDPDITAAPPFNWKTRSSTTEINRMHGLYASYDGRGRPVLIEQLIALPYGSYHLEVTGSTSTRPKGGELAWTLTCLNAREDIAELRLTDSDYSVSKIRASFTVPAEACDGQFVRLVGVPAEFTTSASAEISRVSISRDMTSEMP